MLLRLSLLVSIITMFYACFLGLPRGNERHDLADLAVPNELLPPDQRLLHVSRPLKSQMTPRAAAPFSKVESRKDLKSRDKNTEVPVRVPPTDEPESSYESLLPSSSSYFESLVGLIDARSEYRPDCFEGGCVSNRQALLLGIVLFQGHQKKSFSFDGSWSFGSYAEQTPFLYLQ